MYAINFKLSSSRSPYMEAHNPQRKSLHIAINEESPERYFRTYGTHTEFCTDKLSDYELASSI